MTAPYRESGKESPPPSPDIDPALMAVPQSRLLFIVSLYGGTPFLLLTWLDRGFTCRVAGEVGRATTLTEKVAVTAVFVAWLALLLAHQARHRRRQEAALRTLEEPRLRVSEPEAADLRLRVEPVATANADEEAISDSTRPARRHSS